MKRAIFSIALTLVLLIGLGVVFAPGAAAANFPHPWPKAVGAVYTMTNDPADNEVVVYDRMADGTLTMVDSISTQGTGSGGGFDPLVSQNSLVLTDNGRWLLAANAGSNEITVFRVTRDGLKFADKINSGGTKPTSLTVSFNRVYVLNAGGTPNITGFILGWQGKLNPIPNSTRELASSTYTQVGFNKLGNKLVVVNLGGNEILVYNMFFSVPAPAPVVNASSGVAPFAFIFDNWGRMLVVEVNDGNGAVTSYRIKFDGSLDTISASVASGQAAACWIAGNGFGNVYTTNPGSSSISSYRENFKGEVNLLDATAATGIATLDAGISQFGRFLYALDPNNGGVQMYRIGFDGSLTSLGLAPGGLTTYAQGLAVK